MKGEKAKRRDFFKELKFSKSKAKKKNLKVIFLFKYFPLIRNVIELLFPMKT